MPDDVGDDPGGVRPDHHAGTRGAPRQVAGQRRDGGKDLGEVRGFRIVILASVPHTFHEAIDWMPTWMQRIALKICNFRYEPSVDVR